MGLSEVEEGFRLILRGLGIEDTEHTKDTAHRAAKAWYHELCAGLTGSEPKITTFKSERTAMVLLRNVPIRSVCAHHLLPFVGKAVVAYIPGRGEILGLSKLSRLANYCARRPQVQEDLTEQIADAVAKYVMGVDNTVGMGKKTGGVGVLVRCDHMCMSLRGVQHPGDMMTSALRGVFNEAEVRDEFLRLSGF